MTTKQLLHKKMKEKGYSKIILEVLDISVMEWNSCENIKGEEVS